MFRDVSPATEERVRQFLLAHADTSIYLLSGLRRGDPANLTNRSFGTYRALEENGVIVAVFSLTPSGDLLIETGGRRDLVDQVLEACSADAVPITGIVAEWQAAEAAWFALCPSLLTPTYEAKQVVHRLELGKLELSNAQPGVRPLTEDDFDAWQSLNTEMLTKSGWPVPPDAETWRPGFSKRIAAGYVWGGFDDAALVSMALLDTVYEDVGQIGNVYTAAKHRRSGFGRAVLQALIRDSRTVHALDRLVLFTPESNRAARHLYETLGFVATGEFGMLFGSRRQGA